MRTVTISGKKYSDTTQNTIFPSNVLPQIRIPNEKIPDVKMFSTDVQSVEFSQIDQELTKLVRESKHLRQILDYSRLTVDKMPSYDEQVALLLPSDHSIPDDMLTYKDPRYQDWAIYLANRILKNHSGDEEVEACCRTLLTDYGVCAPYANTLRCDGTMSLKAAWDPQRLQIFGRDFQRILLQEFLERRVEDCIPPKNVTKSCGLNTRWPDGTRADRRDFLYNSSLVTSNIFDNTSRFNVGPFKDEWLRSGRVTENLCFFLDHLDSMTHPEVLLHAMERFGCSVSSEAYRINNADPTLAEMPFSRKTSFFKKNRLWAYEDDGFVFKQGLLDDKSYSEEFRRMNPGHLFTLLKKRPMWPNLNASFTPPFIYLFKKINGRLEHGVSGFPSGSTDFLLGCKDYISECQGYSLKWLNFDRTNSERVIGDNLQLVKVIFGDKIGAIIEALGVAVVPSRLGPRVSVNCFPSGGAQTTAGNFGCGGFENSNLVFELLQLLKRVFLGIKAPDYAEVSKAWNDSIAKNLNYVSFYEDNVRVKFMAGTDDQITGFAIKMQYAERCYKIMEDYLPSYFDERFLGGGLYDSVTCFGIRFTPTDVRTSKSLGLGKFPLIEKDKNGDFMSLKMHSRLCALPEFYDDIAESFIHFGFGNIGTYKKGAINAFRILALQGFPTEEFFNIHSPVEKLILSQALQNEAFRSLADASNNRAYEEKKKLLSKSTFDPRFDTTYDVSYFIQFDKILKEYLIS